MSVKASELGAVLEDALLERDFEVETLNGPGGDFYVWVAKRGSYGHFRVTPNGEILAIGSPDIPVIKAIEDMGLGHRLGEDHKREIFVAYEIITPESAEEGDFEETGEVGTEAIEPDYDETFADAAVKYLKNHGAFQSGGDWFEDEGEIDYQTGAETRHSYHLKSFTKEEKAEIWAEMKRH